MQAVIQTEPFKRVLHLWPEMAVRILYNAYFENLRNVANNVINDVHTAEHIVHYTLAELWVLHREIDISRSKSIQHYLVEVVKARARECVVRYGTPARISKLNSASGSDDEEDVRFVIETPPRPFDKFGFDRSTYHHWHQVEYIFDPWMKRRRRARRRYRNALVLLVGLVLYGCVWYLLR